MIGEYIVTLYDIHHHPHVYGFEKKDLTDNDSSDYPALKALYKARDIYKADRSKRYTLAKEFHINYRGS